MGSTGSRVPDWWRGLAAPAGVAASCHPASAHRGDLPNVGFSENFPQCVLVNGHWMLAYLRYDLEQTSLRKDQKEFCRHAYPTSRP